MASVLGLIASAAGTGLLQRTYFLQSQTQDGIPKILLVLDAVTSEEPEFLADVTEHPVESGPEVSDHIQLKNPTLKLKGTISNNPIDLQTSIGNLLAAGTDLVTSSRARVNALNSGIQQAAGIAGAALLGNSSNPFAAGLTAAADAMARTIFLSAYENRTPFDVITKRQRYESMVIERLSFPRDSQTGFQLQFEVDLKRIRIVSPLTVEIKNLAETVVTSASTNQNLGAQATRGVSAATSAALGNNSILRTLVGG